MAGKNQRGDFTFALPQPDPLHQGERAFSYRERIYTKLYGRL